jgi:hypothetical protein
MHFITAKAGTRRHSEERSRTPTARSRSTDFGDYQYSPTNTVTGSFTTGQNGHVEVDAPLKDVGVG